MVTAQLFDSAGEHVDEATVARLQVPALAGQTVGETPVRAGTDLQVVAVERDGTVHPNPDAEFEIQQADRLIVAGPRTAVTEFERTDAQ